MIPWIHVPVPVFNPFQFCIIGTISYFHEKFTDNRNSIVNIIVWITKANIPYMKNLLCVYNLWPWKMIWAKIVWTTYMYFFFNRSWILARKYMMLWQKKWKAKTWGPQSHWRTTVSGWPSSTQTFRARN